MQKRYKHDENQTKSIETHWNQTKSIETHWNLTKSIETHWNCSESRRMFLFDVFILNLTNSIKIAWNRWGSNQMSLNYAKFLGLTHNFKKKQQFESVLDNSYWFLPNSMCFHEIDMIFNICFAFQIECYSAWAILREPNNARRIQTHLIRSPSIPCDFFMRFVKFRKNNQIKILLRNSDRFQCVSIDLVRFQFDSIDSVWFS